MRYYSPLIYKVPLEEDQWILKTILQKRMQISRTLLSRLKLTEFGITVNGERKFINVRVEQGDQIEVRMEQEESEDILPQKLPITIIDEDEHLLIINKAAGIIVHPTHGHYINTLANAVVYYWQQAGKSYRFRPIHRLDQDTSGVIAIAKNPYIHHLLSEQMKQNQIEKVYLALVEGVMVVNEASIQAPIDRDPNSPHIRMVTADGYRAVTHYKVEQKLKDATLVRLWLETGRTHQIRVHMKHIGHPLLGDKWYGSGKGMQRQALHAIKLGFIHPITKKQVEYEATLPDDMIECMYHLS